MTESREAASKAVLGASNGENQDFLHSRWTKLLWPTVARQPMFRPCLYRKAFPFRVRDISIVVTGVDL